MNISDIRIQILILRQLSEFVVYLIGISLKFIFEFVFGWFAPE